MRAADLTVRLVEIRTSLLAGANGIGSTASAVRELEAFFWAYLRLIQAHPGLFLLLRSSEHIRQRPTRVQIRIEYEGFLEWVRQVIATGIRQGSIRADLDPRTLALLLAGLLEALSTRWILSDCACALAESAAAAWQTFRTLIAPSDGRRADTAKPQGVQ